MTREQALPYVAYVVDDAGNGRGPGADAYAKVGELSRLIGWQCGFEPLFVSVHSYLPNTHLDDQEAEDLAADYLEEIGWFGAGGRRKADYVL